MGDSLHVDAGRDAREARRWNERPVARESGARRPRVVVTHRVEERTLQVLGERCDVVANQTGTTLPRDEVLARCRDADAAMMFMPDTVDRTFLEGCARLRIVAGALRGYDNFDVAAFAERGVWFTVVPELLAGPTAELGVGLLVALARRIPEGDAFVRSGRFAGWQPHLYARGIAGSRIGIAGFGQLGRAVAQRLAGFEATVVYTDVTRASAGDEHRLQVTATSLDELLVTSDHLVLTVPLTTSTYHLIDAHALARMRPGALLVNLSRGSVVCERDVAAALQKGHLGGYAADVYELEDWALPGRPHAIDDGILSPRDRTLLTPHLGSAVTEVRRQIELAAATSILQALNGGVPDGAVIV